VGIDRAGAAFPVEQWADHRARMIVRKRGDLSADFGQTCRRERRQPFAQQRPFAFGQLRNIGQLPAAAVAALGARPVGSIRADRLHARFNIGMNLCQATIQHLAQFLYFSCNMAPSK
jgi:hypothetical protein